MDNAVNLQEGGGANPGVKTCGIPPVAVPEIRAQHPPIPPTSFFHGFGGAGNHMPFLYPHSYMPPIPGFGMVAPTHRPPIATIDLTVGSQKQSPQEFGIANSKSNKKKRVVRKKPEIVELDDDVDLAKTAHHWKDHWVIHLISLRGEMQNTFNAPPKQGVFLFFSFLFSLFSVFVEMQFVLGFMSNPKPMLPTFPKLTEQVHSLTCDFFSLQLLGFYFPLICPKFSHKNST